MKVNIYPDKKEIGLAGVYTQKWSSCVAYAMAACANILGNVVDPAKLRDEVIKWPARWWTWRIRWAINRAIKKWWIRWSKSVLSINDLIESINKWNPIIIETWSIDFNIIGKSNWFMAKINRDIRFPHARHIIWYDKKKEVVIGRWSSWVNWWDKWNFYISFDDALKMWAMYSLYK